MSKRDVSLENDMRTGVSEQKKEEKKTQKIALVIRIHCVHGYVCMCISFVYRFPKKEKKRDNIPNNIGSRSLPARLYHFSRNSYLPKRRKK